MKILKSIYRLFFIFCFVLFTNISLANVNQLSEYYKTIRCLVCEGQSIQESDTEFAAFVARCGGELDTSRDSGREISAYLGGLPPSTTS